MESTPKKNKKKQNGILLAIWSELPVLRSQLHCCYPTLRTMEPLPLYAMRKGQYSVVLFYGDNTAPPVVSFITLKQEMCYLQITRRK